jgi:hypothetical protein
MTPSAAEAVAAIRELLGDAPIDEVIVEATRTRVRIEARRGEKVVKREWRAK